MRKFHTGIFFSCEQAADMNGKPDDKSFTLRKVVKKTKKTGSEDGGRNQTIYLFTAR